MARLTIQISEERRVALKQLAARRGQSMASIIEESLENYGVRTTDEAARLLATARRSAALPEQQAVETGVKASRAVREKS